MIQNYRLQQITDGNDILQMWYIDNQLVDCEYDDGDDDSIKRLINQVKSSSIKSINETCYDLIMTRFDSHGKQLQQLRPEAKFITQREQLINQCDQLQTSIRQRLKSKRWKRADLMTFPGTNWCGKGTTSNQFKKLGRRSTTDRCCRDHDHCKHTILPLTRKYHLFNYRLYVISHCDCDERFRSCLRISNTGSSNLVGKMFFNIVQTKCFIFTKESTCKRRSWWGKCIKMGKIRKAVIKDGLNY
ncbi:group 3 secretory phospholipase A2-like [Panonychus citri]|uniref:group 3 secretory phospholipase A2-like n=1 Tax=Panonychus citri TaxID=50023 RepID=UPI002306FC26|nr:group 3 secretory phospholipase A2-like [Panonychus citri]